MFSQAPDPRLDLGALVRNSRRYFEATVEVLEERGLVPGLPAGGPAFARIRISNARSGFSGTFTVNCRDATPEDWADARAAEARGRATGMGSLAERCRNIWEVESDESPCSEPALLSLAAVLASVALGPVLPEDGSTLFGIRGAMERVERLTRA